jgi:hypothetical protein
MTRVTVTLIAVGLAVWLARDNRTAFDRCTQVHSAGVCLHNLR